MLKARCIVLMLVTLAIHQLNSPNVQAQDRIKEGEMAGYLLVPHERVPDTYNAGFSLYVAAWPLLSEYPGNRFQTGLFGTWMFAQYGNSKPEGDIYSDVEGGLGWWRDTRFATKTPKFIMGGVALRFSEWANGPGAGKGRDWDRPSGKYGVAQLSPWVIWPPDGLNLKQGTCGEFVGYGYLPLPLTESKTKTAGRDVPTGDQSWTLFMNTENFKGPVAFFTPFFWSGPTLTESKLAGLFLDSRPSDPNKAVQMETQYVPSVQARDPKGNIYARIAPTSFPRNAQDRSAVVHRITAYDRSALWNSVKTWLDGGEPPGGTIDPKGSSVHKFKGGGGSTWRIYLPDTKRENKTPLAWKSFAKPVAIDDYTYGYEWNYDVATKTESKNGPLVTLPQYFQLTEKDDKKSEWVVVPSKKVPSATGLTKYAFRRARDSKAEAYVTPDEPNSSWKKPGPVAGPFKTKLGDGSVVTYYWYRFADQPALLNAELTDAEREALQKRVEKLHRAWTKDREYLPPPTIGKLAELDPALLVNPPAGFEVGYVPIVTRQGLED